MEEKKQLDKAILRSPNQSKKLAYTGILPITKTNIEDVITSGYYEDKTIHAWRLLKKGIHTFLIRPRRFGKSLFIDTLDKICQGETHAYLFQDCCIGKDKIKLNPENEKEQEKAYDWKQYPVIRLDFSELSNETPEVLSIDLKKLLYAIATNYGIHPKIKDPDGNDSLKSYFKCLFKQLQSLGNGYEPKVVILIDEYDAPLVKLKWDDAEDSLYIQNQSVLKNFLEEVKACSKDCQLVFVTGVTKFSLSGLCSGANALDDVSIDEAFADVVGYKKESIAALFEDRLTFVSRVWQEETGKAHSPEEIIEVLQSYYNGYRFSKKGPSVYNPSSLLSFFKEGNLKGYWYRKGDPSILLNQMKQDLSKFDIDWETGRFDATEDALLVTRDNRQLDLIPLMYQTGYLTIDRYDPSEQKYLLKFPNAEVRASLAANLEEIANDQEKEEGARYRTDLKEAMDQEDWVRFLTIVQNGCFASSSYAFIQNAEKSFQGLLHSFFQGAFAHAQRDLKIGVHAEHPVGPGRIDIVLDDLSGAQPITYILELKRNGTSREALAQILGKSYARKYYKSQKIVCMGMNFVFDTTKDIHKRNPNHRNIDSCDILVSRKEVFDHDFSKAKLGIQQFIVEDASGRFVSVSNPTRGLSPKLCTYF